jgi:hypothetical protein
MNTRENIMFVSEHNFITANKNIKMAKSVPM